MSRAVADDDDLLAAEYVLGTLSDEDRQAFETKLASDPTLAARIVEWEAKLGRLADAEPIASPGPHVWGAIESRLDDQSIPGSRSVRASAGQWLPLGGGVSAKILHVEVQEGWRSCLLRFEPGAMLPKHSHHRLEECLVLEGEMVIGDVRFGVGDYQIARPGSDHPVVSSPGGGLVFIRGQLNVELEADTREG